MAESHGLVAAKRGNGALQSGYAGESQCLGAGGDTAIGAGQCGSAHADAVGGSGDAGEAQGWDKAGAGKLEHRAGSVRPPEPRRAEEIAVRVGDQGADRTYAGVVIEV